MRRTPSKGYRPGSGSVRVGSWLPNLRVEITGCAAHVLLPDLMSASRMVTLGAAFSAFVVLKPLAGAAHERETKPYNVVR